MNSSSTPAKPTNIIKYYYAGVNDSVFNKVERYDFDASGNPFLYDQLTLTTNNFDNLFYKNNLWYFCFVGGATSLSGLGPMSLPMIIDDPTTSLNAFLSFSPKAIESYNVVNNWGYNNFGGSYNYFYNTDSTVFKAYKLNIITSQVYYNLKKVKK